MPNRFFSFAIRWSTRGNAVFANFTRCAEAAAPGLGACTVIIWGKNPCAHTSRAALLLIHRKRFDAPGEAETPNSQGNRGWLRLWRDGDASMSKPKKRAFGNVSLIAPKEGFMGQVNDV